MIGGQHIITFTTDWQYKSYYLAAVKGAICKISNRINFVDISHNISPFNISHAAYILKNSYHLFPENTIHLIGIATEYTEQTPYVLLKYNNHWFVGTDNGVFSLIFENIKPDFIIHLNINDKQKYSSFPELDVFVDVIEKIINKHNSDEYGKVVNELYTKINLNPVYDEKSINGNVIFIDSYNNIITNITSELFVQVAKGRRFEIYVQNFNYKISSINRTYNESPKGELLAIFNNSGNLEIAMNYSNVAELLNIDTKSKIIIKFYDSQNS